MMQQFWYRPVMKEKNVHFDNEKEMIGMILNENVTLYSIGKMNYMEKLNMIGKELPEHKEKGNLTDYLLNWNEKLTEGTLFIPLVINISPQKKPMSAAW